MPNIAAYTDFKGEIFIPLDVKDVQKGKLEALIAIKEPEFLKYALGLKVYNLFIAGIAATEQRWLDVKNGVEYSENDVDYAWGGIKTPIDLYVYDAWMRNEATQTAIIGETVNKTENSAVVNNAPKVMRAWNEMSKFLAAGLGDSYPPYAGLWFMLLSRKDGAGVRVYPEFEFELSQSMVNFFNPVNSFGI